MGEFGVWRPPLELSEQWETCQAWPRWPWRQSPSPRRPSAGASPAAQVQQPAQHRGPRPARLQSGARGPGPGQPPWSRLPVLPRRAAVQRVVTAMNQMDRKKHEKFANQFNYALN